MQHELKFDVLREKTMPFLYPESPESPEFQEIPEIFATCYMIGLMEWCCIQALEPAIEGGEGNLGVFVQSTHSAATPPGCVVKVQATISVIEGRKITWDVVAWEDLDEIGRGQISLAVVAWDRFNAKLQEKQQKVLLMHA
ncbi:thioesterase family protein [Breoghania sp.]|uniref:thioesterase family protein n=1 Tax=Breoghania sp. TaxID=2065378 RepID=UPI00262470C7|nr:thioesterase family protein [Breoghania sp.]MDJ0930675.1 thioesterase family protein [Breoghania sp.]